MAQQQSPFINVKYGWGYGEDNWNDGMDENLVKFSFMFDGNVNEITNALPVSPSQGYSLFNTADNKFYYFVNSFWYNSPCPKNFIFKIKTTGEFYQFNGTTSVKIENPSELDSRFDSIELTLSSLGTAAFKNSEYFAKDADLTSAKLEAKNYTDALKSDLANTSDVQKGTALVAKSLQNVNSIASLKAILKTSPSQMANVLGYYTPGDGGGGIYYLDSADTTSLDNGGTIIVATDGGRWKLVNDGKISVAQFGANPSQTASVNRQAFQAAINSFSLTGTLFIPPGIFNIDNSIFCDDKFITFYGAGVSSSIIRYTPSTPGILFDLRHTVSNGKSFSFKDMSIITNFTNAGTAIKISAKLTGASIQVNGEDDSLFLNNVRISQEGSGYWTTFLHTLHTGGVHLNSVSFDNTLTSAQNNSSVYGIIVENSDVRVSTIRTLAVNDYYILRTAIAVNLMGNNTRQIESVYFNTGEIVGVSEAAIKCSGLVGAFGFVNGHFDVNKYILDSRNSNFLIGRFVGCDFRKGQTGGSIVNGPMFSFDAGEMVTFAGCMFSGCNQVSPSTSNTAFDFNNTYNGQALYRSTVASSVFRNFHYIFGDSLNCKLNTSGNTYNAIAGTVLKDDRLDNSISVRDATVMKTLTASLDNTGTATVNVTVPDKFFGAAWPVAILQPASTTGTDNLSIRYDFDTSTGTNCVFIVKGNTTARTVRFSFIASGVIDPTAA